MHGYALWLATVKIRVFFSECLNRSAIIVKISRMVQIKNGSHAIAEKKNVVLLPPQKQFGM